MILDNIKSDNMYISLLNSADKNDIIVVEDIDRTNFSKHLKVNTDTSEYKGVSISTILNSLDGLLSNNGRITIFTANHPESLDPVLFRPGRIDHIYHLGKCDQIQIAKIYELI